MLQHQDRVAAIRKVIAAELEVISELEMLVTDSDYIQMRLNLLRQWLHDVEAIFLSELSLTQPDSETEAKWLKCTELYLQMTVQLRKTIERSIKGPSVDLAA